MEKLRVPENLNMSELIEIYPVNEIKGFHKDKVYFVCDSILRQMLKLDSNNCYLDKDEPFFVPLQTTILRKVMGGNNYKGVIDWMVEAGIILVDGSWEKEKISMGYRLTDYFIDADITWKTVTNWTVLKKHVNKSFKNEIYFAPAVVKNLKKWFDGSRLKIDKERALEAIGSCGSHFINDISTQTTKIHERTLRTDKDYLRGTASIR